MAEKLEEYEFKNQRSTGKGKYPWDQWLDGDVWQLTHGEDFTTEVANFRSWAYHNARKRGGTLRTNNPSTDVLIIQFVQKPVE